MRHRVAHRKLGRTTEHRLSLLRNLATSLITHERIRTTLAKAKELRPFAERLITLGKKDSLHARRRVLAVIPWKEAVAKVFDELSPRFADRPGGYTRILKLGPRGGDGAEMAFIEFVDYVYSPGKEAKAPKETKEEKKGKKEGKEKKERKGAEVAEPDEEPEKKTAAAKTKKTGKRATKKTTAQKATMKAAKKTSKKTARKTAKTKKG